MKKTKLTLLIVLLIGIVISGTFAFFTLASRRSALVLVLGERDEVLVTLTPFEMKGTLMSTLDYNEFTTNDIEKDYITITAQNFSDEPKNVYFYYRMNSIDNALVSSNVKYTITTSDTQDGTYTFLDTGNFSTAASGHDLIAYSFTLEANTTKFYQVFTYLDGSVDTSSMAGATIDAEFRAEMEHKIVPDLDAGMIPIVIDNSSGSAVVKTISSNDEDWFDYKNKEWANVILVTEESRSTYLNTENVTVNQDDILAYYVWIPRFEYRYDNLGTSYAGGTQASPGAISINFISKSRTLPSSGAYKIHPAFTFGDTELAGFWVGKFENTGTMAQPTVLPNENALSSFNAYKDYMINPPADADSITEEEAMFRTLFNNKYNISGHFKMNLKFNGGVLSDGDVMFVGSDYYGTTNEFNSHMSKNSEWAAITYLTQSLYGRCDNPTTCSEVYFNPVLTNDELGLLKTGYSAGATFENQVDGIYYSWDIQGNGTGASTTGNISGIYDMEGNLSEYTMGVLQYNGSFIYTGINVFDGFEKCPNTSSNCTLSGFHGYDINNTLTGDNSFVDMPTQKYYDRYSSSNVNSSTISLSSTACNGKMCYGHGLSETNGWYGANDSYFVTKTNSWITRGNNITGEFGEYSPVNIFSTAANAGISNMNTISLASRSVIVKENDDALDTSDIENDGTLYSTILLAESDAPSINFAKDYIESKRTPNFSISATTDEGLYATEDDTGTAYYYRGAVDDNHVIFAGFCWDIIRTTGTGGVKMIYDGVPVDGQCNNSGEDITIGESRFNLNDKLTDLGYMITDIDISNSYISTIASNENTNTNIVYANDVVYDSTTGLYTLTGDTFTSNFNYNQWQVDYNTIASKYHYTCFSDQTSCSKVRYIYYVNLNGYYYAVFSGGTTSSTYLTEIFANTNNSEVKSFVDSWYEQHLMTYTNKLEDTPYCNDRSLANDVFNKDTNVTSGLDFNSFYRNSFNTPSLICNQNNDKFTVNSLNGNGKLTYPIGLITFDEMFFASSSSYLIDSNVNLWTMSPVLYDVVEATAVFLVSSTPNVPSISASISLVNYKNAVRPVISLKAGTLVSGGNGSSTTPYIVN